MKNGRRSLRRKTGRQPPKGVLIMLLTATLPPQAEIVHVKATVDDFGQLANDVDAFDPAGDFLMAEAEADEQAFADAVKTIEQLGSHFVERAIYRWQQMARAAAALVANASPEDIGF
jgi:hypothetical protein